MIDILGRKGVSIQEERECMQDRCKDMAKSIAELRGMQRTQLSKPNKEVIIDNILSSRDDEGSQLHARLAEISTELVQLRQFIKSPDSTIHWKMECYANSIKLMLSSSSNFS